MVKKKTWSRKNVVIVCGYCLMCKRQLLSNEGGWIINAEKKYFCHHYMVQKVASINIQRRNIMPGHYGKKMKKPSMVKKAKKKKNKKKK